MSLHQAVVWIDEREAQILRVEDGIHRESTVSAPDEPQLSDQPHGDEKAPGDPNTFFRQVAFAIRTADEILIVGPSSIKSEFVKYMHKKDHGFDPRILGVETIDHPDDPQLASYVKIYLTEGGPRRSGQGSGYREPD
jgi:hypothetical protein